jgi:hypothetical protein
MRRLRASTTATMVPTPPRRVHQSTIHRERLFLTSHRFCRRTGEVQEIILESGLVAAPGNILRKRFEIRTASAGHRPAAEVTSRMLAFTIAAVRDILEWPRLHR